MKTISAIKNEQQNKLTEIFKQRQMFFAFSNEQFEKNKCALKDGDKYTSFGSGGFLPNSELTAFKKDMQELDQWFKDEIKNNDLRKKLILDELNNHECFYTGDINVVVGILSEKYSYEEIYKVYKEEYNNYAQANNI